MPVTKTDRRRFSTDLGTLPSCIPTQGASGLFNFDLYCPLSDIRTDRCHSGPRRRYAQIPADALASAGAGAGSGFLLGLAISPGLNRLISRWVENGAHDPWLIL